MIQPLDLNLASRPFRNNTIVWAGYSLALILLLAFTLWNITAYGEARDSLALLEDRINTIDQEFADLEERQVIADSGVKKFDLDALSVRAHMTNEVIGSKAFSWTLLFNRMEGVLPWNVELVSISPNFRQRRGQQTIMQADARREFQIMVEGYAKDLGALLDFERALFQDGQFDRPEPEQHELMDNGEVGFTLSFTYFPDIVEEAAEEQEEQAAEQAENEPAAGPADAQQAAQAGGAGL